MIPFLIGKEKVSCPQNWEEVSVSSFIKLKSAKSLSKIFKALTGCELPFDEAQIETQIFPYLTFVSEVMDFDKLPLPESIGEYKPLKSLGSGTYGQKIAAQRIIHDAFKNKQKNIDVTSFMVELLEVYLPET